MSVLTAAMAAAAPGQAAEAQADGQWRGNVTAAVSATAGNTDTTAVLVKADGVRLTHDDKTSLGGTVNYARSTVDEVRQTTANKFGLYGQYDHDLAPRLVVFGRVTADRDDLNNLSLRAAISSGLGWKLVRNDTTQFTLYGGLGYTRDRYSELQTQDGRSGTRFERSSLMLAEESSHQLTPTVRLKQRLELNPAVGGDRSNLLKFSGDLGVALNSTMSLSVGLQLSHDSRPPVGMKRTDRSLFTGLEIKFGT